MWSEKDMVLREEEKEEEGRRPRGRGNLSRRGTETPNRGIWRGRRREAREGTERKREGSEREVRGRERERQRRRV